MRDRFSTIKRQCRRQLLLTKTISARPHVTPRSPVKAIRSGLSVYWRFSTEVTQYSMYNTASLWTHYIKVRILRERKNPTRNEQIYYFFLLAYRSTIDLYRQVFFNLKQDKSRLYEKRPDWLQDQEDKHQWKPRVDIPSKNISGSIYLAEDAWKQNILTNWLIVKQHTLSTDSLASLQIRHPLSLPEDNISRNVFMNQSLYLTGKKSYNVMQYDTFM